MRPGRADLLRAARVLDVDPHEVAVRHGYIDLVGRSTPPAAGVAQRLMNTRVVPAVYERWWRPALGRLVKGPSGPSTADEQRLAVDLLRIAGGATVVDVACGPGNFTRTFAAVVGTSGTVIGIDVSPTMLARAVRDTDSSHVVYVRADAADIPLRAGTADAVCCFGALHLFPDPWAALDAMAGALVPGGRLAILTSARPRPFPTAVLAGMGARAAGVRMFGSGELADAVTDRGLEVVDQRRFGASQVLAARRPPTPRPAAAADNADNQQ